MFLYSLLIIHEKALVALELRNNKGTPLTTLHASLKQ